MCVGNEERKNGSKEDSSEGVIEGVRKKGEKTLQTQNVEMEALSSYVDESTSSSSGDGQVLWIGFVAAAISVVGFGCETSIFFIFNSFCFKITLTSLTYPNSLYKTRIGNISSPQRYKIIYKIETLYPYNILINLINLKISIMIPIPKMTYNNISTATACT